MESYLFCFTIDIHITVGNENARKLKKKKHDLYV